MKVNLSEHLKSHPNYLIPALILADEGNLDPIFAILKTEKNVFDTLRSARAYAGHMGTYPATDYPISINGKGEIIKQPERLAGLILAGKTWFWSIYGDLPGSPLYGEDWLKNQTPDVIAALSDKMLTLTQSPSDDVKTVKLSTPSPYLSANTSPEKSKLS